MPLVDLVCSVLTIQCNALKLSGFGAVDQFLRHLVDVASRSEGVPAEELHSRLVAFHADAPEEVTWTASKKSSPKSRKSSFMQPWEELDESERSVFEVISEFGAWMAGGE